MSHITEAIETVRGFLPQNVRLIAVSKTHPAEYISEAYSIGQRDFGENKVQEMTQKAEVLPKDIRWHMIGHLQTNKVKYIAPYVYMIHSIDSEHLLQAVNKEAIKAGRVVKCLLQVHIAKEETKFGFSPEEVVTFLQAGTYKEMKNVEICGIMGMATNTDDDEEVSAEFGQLHSIFLDVKEKYFKEIESFSELSMGMSGDYRIAVAQGATMVRIGSSIFGKRIYDKATTSCN